MHDVREVLDGTASVGERVLVIAQDDHMPPLAVADLLAQRGHAVTLVYSTNGPAPLISRYSIGGIMARLEEAGVRLRFSEQVVGIEPGRVRTRRVYSHQDGAIEGIDSVVLACGGVPQGELLTELRGRVPEVHVVGDAFAPRRHLYATRQAYALVTELG